MRGQTQNLALTFTLVIFDHGPNENTLFLQGAYYLSDANLIGAYDSNTGGPVSRPVAVSLRD